MSVTVNFYNIDKRGNSTKRPSNIAATYNCDFIEATDILEPIIKCHFNTGSTPPMPDTTKPSYNFAQITNFDNRYYYITNWSYANGFWYCKMECDTLASWKTTIGRTEQFVTRSDKAFRNEQIIDNFNIATVGKEIQRNEFQPVPNGLDPGITYLWTKIGSQRTAAGSLWYEPNVVVLLNIEEYRKNGETDWTTAHEGITILRVSYYTFLNMIFQICKEKGTDYCTKAVLAAYFCPLSDQEFYANHTQDRINGIKIGKLIFLDEDIFYPAVINLGPGYHYLVKDTSITADFYVDIPRRSQGSEDWKKSHIGRSTYIVGQPFGKVQLDTDMLLIADAVRVRFVMETLNGNAKVYLSPLTKDDQGYHIITGKEDYYFTTICLYAKIPYVASGYGNVTQRNFDIIFGVVRTVVDIAMMVSGAGTFIGAADAAANLNSLNAQGAKYDIQQKDIALEKRIPYLSQEAGEKAIADLDYERNVVEAQLAKDDATARSLATAGALNLAGRATSTMSGAIKDILNATRTSTIQSSATGDLTLGDNPLELQTEDSLYTETPYKMCGYPCCKYYTISSIGKTSATDSYGFIKCESPILPLDTGMTVSENAMIRAAMAGGFYYE